MPGPSWLEKRSQLPDQLRRDDLFTDVSLVVGNATFRAHRVVLAAHSEYFLHLFTSGMREVSEGRVTFHEVDEDVFRHILEYVYTGRVPERASFEVLRDVLLAANMWQIQDLESAVLNFLVRECSPARCLKIFLFLNSSGDLFKETMPDGGRESVEKLLAETIRDRWQIIAGTAAAAASDADADEGDFCASLCDLDLDSLKLILSIKSDQEEIADFSFSFNQSDICLGVVNWIRHDGNTAERYPFLSEHLDQYFCLHQISSSASTALTVLHAEASGNEELSSQMLDVSFCRGVWCPQRRIPGLLIAHAWSPHVSNRITCDHIFFYFTIPKAMDNEQSRPLHTDFFYDVGQFGELGDGEKHLLIPNNCVDVGGDGDGDGDGVSRHMLLTVDEGTLSGTVVDPVGLTHRCRHKHVPAYRFCPSNVPECSCDFNQMTLCADRDEGRIFISACPPCLEKEAEKRRQEGQAPEPTCETFRILAGSAEKGGCGEKYSGRMSVFRPQDKSVATFGGYVVQTGETFSFVHCVFDLQEFAHSRPSGAGGGDGAEGGEGASSAATQLFYKSGHSHIKTAIGYLLDTPRPSSKFTITTATDEMKVIEEPDMKNGFYKEGIGDAATIVVGEKIYCIGGFKIEYDSDLKLFYQSPQTSVKVFDFSTSEWTDGPPLLPSSSSASSSASPPPSFGLRPGVTRGTAYCREGSIYFSGGACLRVNEERVSNQIYEYVPNTQVFQLSPDGKAWTVLLDLSRFASKLRDDAYSVLAIFPTDISLTRLKIQKNQAGSKFMVKYLNINFPLGRGGSGGVGGASLSFAVGKRGDFQQGKVKLRL